MCQFDVGDIRVVQLEVEASEDSRQSDVEFCVGQTVPKQKQKTSKSASCSQTPKPIL
jgi:hypothetical protein